MRKLRLIVPVALVLVTSAAVTKESPLRYVFTQTATYDSVAWLRGGERFPQGATLYISTGGVKRALAPDFFASADATVSFDGTRVLFAGKRTAGERWQIWELALTDGAAPRRVTNTGSDCVRPFYLPEDKLVYTRDSFLEVADLNGSGTPDRITYGPARVLTNDVLRDGRILFESMQSGSRELFTVYPDGTSVESVRCEHGTDRGDARQLSTGDLLFTANARLARFIAASPHQKEVAQPKFDLAGPVAEIAAGDWIVSLKRKSGEFGLARVRGAEIVAELESPGVEPVLVAPRVAPKRFPTARTPARTWGNLLCLDARAFRGDRHATEVARIRAYTKGDVLLGDTAVEADGSFYIQVPADKPLRIEALDASGRVVEAEHGWFWMRPAEQRICVGCHTGPERSPENRVPDVLLKSTVPVNMMGASQ